MVERKTCKAPGRNFLLEECQIKVLLVEDNRVSQLVSRVLLQNWGIEVHIANNGLEALEMVREEVYDLILMNLYMPEMDGFEATKNIRLMSEHYRPLPIIALTASEAMQCREWAGAAGVTELLIKPLRPELLYRMICKHLHITANTEYVKNKPFNPAHMQQKLEEIAQGDVDFQKQLTLLYLKSFREILEGLNNGQLQNAEDLRRIRHKHKTSIMMLDLKDFELALLCLQEHLDAGTTDLADIRCNIDEINLLGEQIILDLTAIA